MSTDRRALRGLRVVDLSEGIAGSYCTKLLADAGADVVKVEPPSGDPLRARSLSGSLGADGYPDGALFRYLCGEKRSLRADLRLPRGRRTVLRLAADSDVLVETFRPGVMESYDLGYDDLAAHNERLVVVSVSPFGRGGPRSGDHASELVLQALGGALSAHRTPSGTPLEIGGDIGQWAAGAYAAVGALTALANRRRTARGDHVDVSMLECVAVTLVGGYPTVSAGFPGSRRGLRATLVSTAFECSDGFVGLCPFTGQQWLDLFALIERPDLAADPAMLDPETRAARSDEVVDAVRRWTRHRRAEEVAELATLFRVPAAPAGNGANLPHSGQLAARGFYERDPRGGFLRPRPPFRFRLAPGELGPPAPAPGAAHDPAPSVPAGPAGDLPFSGLRVLDLSSFWAGPYVTQYLAATGADVIKVESVGRPDPMRLSAMVSPSEPEWYEQSPMFHATNLGKRGITLDLADPRGRDLALELVAGCDLVVENFTPRVMRQLRLTYDDLARARPDVVVARMPAFGLEGPWRDVPGFAATIEMASGIAWTTGLEDGPPVPPGGICDPLAGVHSVFAILVALELRRATGRGAEVEVAMLETAANVAAEQVVEHSAYGALLTRTGNRSPAAAPVGVYACADGEHVALAVESDEHWRALRRALGDPEWAGEPVLQEVSGRLARTRCVDQLVGEWFARTPARAAARILAEAGVPSAPVVPAAAIDQDPQMRARGFWQPVSHAVVGRHDYPGWPFRLARGSSPRYLAPAPRFGEHTVAVLGGELGLTDDELEQLRSAGVIGDRPRDL